MKALLSLCGYGGKSDPAHPMEKEGKYGCQRSLGTEVITILAPESSGCKDDLSLF